MGPILEKSVFFSLASFIFLFRSYLILKWFGLGLFSCISTFHLCYSSLILRWSLIVDRWNSLQDIQSSNHNTSKILLMFATALGQVNIIAWMMLFAVKTFWVNCRFGPYGLLIYVVRPIDFYSFGYDPFEHLLLWF